MARAHHRGDDGFDAAAQAAFIIGGVFLLVAGHGAGLVAARQQVAAIVHDGDAVGAQRGDGGGDHVLDGLDLALVHAAAGLEHHRGGGRLFLLGEDLAFGDDQVNAGRFHALDGLDRARQLPFQGAQMIDVLDEGGGAEGVRLVENLIADARGGQVLLRQRHAQLGHLVGGDQDGAAVLDVILDRHGVQLGGHGGGVARFQPGEQDGLGRFGQRARDIEEEGGENGGHAGHHAEPRRANRFKELGQDVLLEETRGKPPCRC